MKVVKNIFQKKIIVLFLVSSLFLTESILHAANKDPGVTVNVIYIPIEKCTLSTKPSSTIKKIGQVSFLAVAAFLGAGLNSLSSTPEVICSVENTYYCNCPVSGNLSTPPKLNVTDEDFLEPLANADQLSVAEEPSALASSDHLLTKIRISAGEFHTCALKGGDPVCWGGSTPEATKVPEGIPYAMEISSGGFHNCVLLKDGSVRCWGADIEGVLKVPSEEGPFVGIDCGGSGAGAISEKNNLTFWWGRGKGTSYSLGDIGNPHESISVGITDLQCAVHRKNGLATCSGHPYTKACSVPVDLGPVKRILAGNDYACAIKKFNNKVVCWGDNSKINDVPRDLENVTEIDGGRKFVCGLASGEIYCWGSEVPDVPNVRRRALSRGDEVIEIAAGYYHVCALTKKSELKCYSIRTHYNRGQDVVPRKVREFLLAE